jgi:type II secretory pathway component PulK
VKKERAVKGLADERGMSDLPSTERSSLTNEAGIALMMVLWVLVLLSIMSLTYFGANRWNSAGTRNLKEETLSYALAMSGYQEAVNYLLSDKDLAVDFIDEEGNFWTDTEREPLTSKRVTEDGEVEIKITDENAKININFADQNRLRNIFLYEGIPDESVAGIVDSILDWKDPDSEHHLSGAEDEYYEGLEDPYPAKNALFTLPEELALVKGMRPEYFSDKGENEGKSLLRYITTFGRNTININTVSKEVMQILGFDDGQIEAIIKQRNKESGGFRFIPPQFSAKGLNAMASQNIRIEVTAKTNNSSLGMKIVSVVNRKPAAAGYTIHSVYWREDAENIRS